MKILGVTGRLAEYDVKKEVEDHADVLVVDINIAAFINITVYGNRRYFRRINVYRVHTDGNRRF